MKLSSRYLSQGLFCGHNCKNACFCCSCSYLELCSEESLFCLPRWWSHFVKVAPNFAKPMCGHRARVFVFAHYCSTSAIKNQKIEPRNNSPLRVLHKVSYEQQNEDYRISTFCSLQCGITEWLVDIQNMSTLTGDKLKKKICSLKLTRPLSKELVVFDTHPQDFIVISDDLMTANMDPCQSSHLKCLSHFFKGLIL